MIAYLLAKREFTGKWLADVLLTLAPCPAPDSDRIHPGAPAREKTGFWEAFSLAITGSGILFTWQAAAIAAFVVSLPLMVKTASSSIGAVDRSVEEAACIWEEVNSKQHSS